MSARFTKLQPQMLKRNTLGTVQYLVVGGGVEDLEGGYAILCEIADLYRVASGQGKVREKIFFKVSEKSGNFTKSQGI